MSAVAIIPARGGSKRIPGKNIRDFLGKPILAYSIQAALESKLFDEVMVSTDDEEIASIANTYGANVPFFRSDQNSNDFATTVDVLIEVISQYKGSGKLFDFGCCIYPTAPFVTAQRLIEGYELLVKNKYDSVFPITKFSYPIWRALKIEKEKVKMIWPENMTKRTQDLPAAYQDAGQWYWSTCDKLLLNKCLWTDNSFGLELSDFETQDIDNEHDWRLAELKFSQIN